MVKEFRFLNPLALKAGGPGYIIVINTATNKVLTTIQCLGCGFPLAVTPDRKHIYVGGSAVSVIDTALNQVTNVIQVASNSGVTLTPNGRHVYVINGIVSVIDTATNQVDTTISVGGPAPAALTGIAITPDGKRAYVTNDSNGIGGAPNSVDVIGTEDNKVITAITVTNPVGIGIIPPPPGIPFRTFQAKLSSTRAFCR